MAEGEENRENWGGTGMTEEKWKIIERLGLCSTIIVALITCTVTSCTAQYAIRDSERNRRQDAVTFRPWIAIGAVDTYFVGNRMYTKVHLANEGPVPAKCHVSGIVRLDGKEDAGDGKTMLIFPNQQGVVYACGAISGKTYDDIRAGEFEGKLEQEIRVVYSPINDLASEFEAQNTYIFDTEELILPLDPSVPQGLWNIVDTTAN